MIVALYCVAHASQELSLGKQDIPRSGREWSARRRKHSFAPRKDSLLVLAELVGCEQLLRVCLVKESERVELALRVHKRAESKPAYGGTRRVICCVRSFTVDLCLGCAVMIRDAPRFFTRACGLERWKAALGWYLDAACRVKNTFGIFADAHAAAGGQSGPKQPKFRLAQIR